MKQMIFSGIFGSLLFCVKASCKSAAYCKQQQIIIIKNKLKPGPSRRCSVIQAEDQRDMTENDFRLIWH